MNKKLLASVSLLAILISAPSKADYVVARSKDLKITLGADVDLQSGARFQSASKTKQSIGGTVFKIGPSANNSDLAFITSASAFLGAENKTKSDIVYGIQVGIFTSTRGSFPSKDHLARTYAYFERNDFGRFEIGTKKGASTSMSLDGDDVTAGTGAFNGDWSKYLSLNAYQGPDYVNQAVNDGNFIDSTRLIIKDNASDTANNEGSRKVTYYTPKYKGFQLGLSYVPDEVNRGGNITTGSPFVATGPTGNLKNAVLAAISYEKQIDEKQKVKVVLVGETGRLVRSVADTQAKNKFPSQPFAFDIGAQYDYDKFSIAGSFGNKGKFKYKKQSGLRNGVFYTIGLGYKCTDKIKTSIAYFHSDNRNKLDIISVGASYNWLSGVQPYAEVNYITAHQKWNFISFTPGTATVPAKGGALGPTNAKTKGAVAIVGMRFDF